MGGVNPCFKLYTVTPAAGVTLHSLAASCVKSQRCAEGRRWRAPGCWIHWRKVVICADVGHVKHAGNTPGTSSFTYM